MNELTPLIELQMPNGQHIYAPISDASIKRMHANDEEADVGGKHMRLTGAGSEKPETTATKRPGTPRALHLSPEFSTSSFQQLELMPSPIVSTSIITPPGQVKSELNTPTLPDVPLTTDSAVFQFPTNGFPSPIGHSPNIITIVPNDPTWYHQGCHVQSTATPIRAVLTQQSESILSPFITNASAVSSMHPFTSSTTTFQCTPTTTKPPRSNIAPSTKKIINLMPVFSKGQPPDRVARSFAEPVHAMSPFLGVPPSSSCSILTPLSHAMDAGLLAPLENQQTPTVRPIATPGSFFRSTPGGVSSESPTVFILNGLQEKIYLKKMVLNILMQNFI